jgi:anhydro-N-acetylmuramic acid kinase
MDGIDAVLVRFDEDPQKTAIIASHLEPIPMALKNETLAMSMGRAPEHFLCVAKLDVQWGRLFAQSVHHLLEKAGVPPESVRGIGSHGQTLWHHPHPPYPFTLQIGDPNIIAAETGITTVGDFRRADIALGGQGAPLVPRFHEWYFGSQQSRIIANIGGISNITVLPFQNKPCLGFDTGPGNGLMDAWTQLHTGAPFDRDAIFARQGHCNEKLLQHLLDDPYFARPFPKSTGKDYFNLPWLNNALASFEISAQDVQATLLSLTAVSMARSIQSCRDGAEILVCGGGTHNSLLIKSLQQALGSNFVVASTEKYGLHPDWVEALCFAWLAKKRLDLQPVDFTAITGAHRPALLGGIYG